MSRIFRVRIIGGALVGKTQAVLQEADGFTVVDGNLCQQWKDVTPLTVFEEGWKGIVPLSRSDLDDVMLSLQPLA